VHLDSMQSGTSLMY